MGARKSQTFQSTLPVWGATGGKGKGRRKCKNFNPRSPCGERLFEAVATDVNVNISIHAPRVGSDAGCQAGKAQLGHFNPRSPCGERPTHTTTPSSAQRFQSTLPVWGATPLLQSSSRTHRFQSTLPVWGATKCLTPVLNLFKNFNPRSPCGERPPEGGSVE